MQQIGAGGSAQRRVEHGIDGELLHVRSRQFRIVHCLKPFGLGVEDDLRTVSEQLAHLIGRALPLHA